MTEREDEFTSEDNDPVELKLRNHPLTDSNSSFRSFVTQNITLPDKWMSGSFVVVALAAFLRIYWLGLKPMHQDEGVNGVFLATLLRDGIYKYDPNNYHGPALYYFALVSSYLFGLNDFALRFVTALFGILTVVMVLSLRRYLGDVGALIAGLFIALSPGLTFISRYFIHETLFLFFTFGVLFCSLKFIEGKRPGRIASTVLSLLIFVCLIPGVLKFASLVGGANEEAVLITRFLLFGIVAAFVYVVTRLLLKLRNGDSLYPLLAAASGMLAFATKETAFISFGTMLIAVGCVWGWTKFIANENNLNKNRRRAFVILHLAFLLLAAYFRSDLWRGSVWFYENYFLNVAKKEQPLVFIAVVILLLASVMVWIKYLAEHWFYQAGKSVSDDPLKLNFQTLIARSGSSKSALVILTLCLGFFAFIGVLLFSSFFTYREGIWAGFEAYNVWTKTGTQAHTQNGLWAYVRWLIGAEAPLLILGVLGSLIAFWKSEHRFAMFTALWGFGLFAAYSIIPYKTPWLAINFVLPIGLVAGYGINELAISKKKWQMIAAAFLTILGVSICEYQTIELNFYRYDDDSRPYVYAHTRRSMDEMLKEIERVTNRAGTGKQASVVITSPEHWPLPWELRGYKRTGFYGKVIDAPKSEVIIGLTAQAAELEQKYSKTHQLKGTYSLRPGADLLLYVRQDLTTE